MSEYQYYEFQALASLTQREMRELRKHSTRAIITDTRFVNHYEWGTFKGDTSVWMRKYFDAFLYCANWGTHSLMLRLSPGALDVKTAKRYLRTRSVSAHRKDNIVILDFGADDDSGDWTEDGDGSGLLSSLIALRADIGAGDHRGEFRVLELRMGRKSITGGIIPAGLSRIRFDFTVDGQRFRPTLPWIPNEANLQRARTHLARIKAQIAASTFCFADEFPRYRGLQKLPPETPTSNVRANVR